MDVSTLNTHFSSPASPFVATDSLSPHIATPCQVFQATQPALENPSFSNNRAKKITQPPVCNSTSSILQRIIAVFRRIISALLEIAYAMCRFGSGKTVPSHTVPHVERENSTATPPKTKPVMVQAPPLIFTDACPEHVLKTYACAAVDVKADCGFPDYLTPNENVGTGLKPHLDHMSPGLIVSVGTERCFFDLLLSDPKTCDGLVVRDINPRVKAYVDFNVLLLRVSNSREEYCELAERPKSDDAKQQRLNRIRTKLSTDQHIPQFLREYYQKNLEPFAETFDKGEKDWANPSIDTRSHYFTEVNYHTDDALFAKIQQYAKKGKIVATIGSINDLSFLNDQKISVIDASNVDSYIFLDIQGYPFSHPVRLIWSRDCGRLAALYFSVQYTPLTAHEREELDLLLRHMNDSTGTKACDTEAWVTLLRQLTYSDKNKAIPAACYSRETLGTIREYCDEYLIEIPGFGFVDMNTRCKYLRRLNTIPKQFIEQLTQDPRLGRHVTRLVEDWYDMDVKVYIEFMGVPGWKEAFEKRLKPGDIAPLVLKRLREHGLLETFIERFGKDRISRWSPERQAMLSHTTPISV